MFLDPLQLDLAPVRRNRSRTVQSATRVLGIADYSLQRHARMLHVQHLARTFLNDRRHRLSDLDDAAAIGRHLLRIETQAVILAVLTDGLFGLGLRLDAHVFAGLKVGLRSSLAVGVGTPS
jgi:hypothetical protein